MNTNIEDAIRKFIKNHKNYRDYDVSWGVVQKVYNRGMGCRDLFRVYPEVKKIVIAEDFCNSRDMSNLCELGILLGFDYYEMVFCTPDPISKKISLKMCGK